MEEDNYRNTINVVNKKGERNWVFAKRPKGSLYTGRTWFSLLLLVILFGTPFLSYNNHPLILLNIIERKFILFGVPFWPQDLPLVALLMLTFVVFIIVFTVLFGRVFCGWACPQTIFMEMVFRKIEYWIEGDFKAQQKLKAQEWNQEKILKTGAKHIIFFSIAVLIANTFLSYILGIDEVKKLIIEGPSAHIGKFISLIIFSFIFYIVYIKVREVVCIVICPYGRLQGLMLDKNSIVVGYDFKRGEPRGFLKKNEVQKTGDCIDCKRCVQVCPTGIDIRNGTQLECINCTACIDECNDVMLKINKPKGLIRYTSQEGIEKGASKRITVRSGAYIIILLLLTTLLSYLLYTRKPIEANVLRTPGMLFQQQSDSVVSNMYNFEVLNKTFDLQKIEIKIISPVNATLKMVDRESNDFDLAEDDLIKGSFFINIPLNQITQNNTTTEIGVYRNEKLVDVIKTNFLGPVK